MSASRSRRPARAALAAAAIALAAAHAPAFATTDLTIGAVTCVPGTPPTVQRESVNPPVKLIAQGAIQQAGPNPPLTYLCPVWSPDDFATQPGWKRMALQYSDTNLAGNGRVRARLFSKNRKTGAVAVVATVSSVPTAGVVKVISAPLGAVLDFSTSAYYIVLDLNTQPGTIAAHMVMLTS